MTIVGDSLLEPFWPEGTGCARGFLSSMDAAWMFRRWVQGRHNPLDIICERENIYRYICIVILVYLIDACMVLKFSILLNIFFEKIYGPHTEEWKRRGSFTLQK